MFRPIEYEHFARHRLGSDQVGVLGHIPRAVDLTRMVDPLSDLHPRLCRDGMATEFTAFVVVVPTV